MDLQELELQFPVIHNIYYIIYIYIYIYIKYKIKLCFTSLICITIEYNLYFTTTYL